MILKWLRVCTRPRCNVFDKWSHLETHEEREGQRADDDDPGQRRQDTATNPGVPTIVVVRYNR